MGLRINDIAPNFTAKTTDGEIDFHTWIDDSYAILFSHPKDVSANVWSKKILDTEIRLPITSYP